MSPNTNAILAQYASPAGRALYRRMMGGGGDHIHYGIHSGDNDPPHEAATRSSRQLLDGVLGSGLAPLRILDLGAGAGGAAKCLLEWTSATVVCVDLGEEPLRGLETWAKEAGLSSRLEVQVRSFESLPSAWEGRFDLVWSQDAFCHAEDRGAVFREARRVLGRSGVLAFTDILLSETSPPDEARVFASVNSGPRLGMPTEDLRELARAGFGSIRREDWSRHLPRNFRRMLDILRNEREALLEDGVEESTLDEFGASLERRLRWPVGGVLQWWAHWCRP